MRVVLAWLLLVAASSLHADVFRVLDEPREAMQARVDVIQQAETQVHALYFLAKNDRVTLAALALLRDARRRGVPSVKLVVDANFSHIPKGVLAHLRDEGVEVRVYHPLTLRHPSWMFRRMHEKVIVADGEKYIAGGRNLAEAYFGLARKNYVDRDVYVEGDSAADADRHFENIWSSRHVAELDVTVSGREKKRAALRLTEALHELANGGFIALDTGRDWSEGEKQVDDVRFVHDPVVPANGPRVAVRFAEVLESASESILIESPYLVPSPAMLELLRRKVASGVDVTVLTNSLRSCDGVLPQAGYLRHRRRLLRAGIDVHEYKGPDMLHAKSAVIDGRVVIVGSYNLDPRSENLNTELLCITADEEIAREVSASIREHLTNAWQVGGAPAPAVHDPYPGVSRTTAFRAWAMRLLVPLIEGQL